MQLVKEDDLRAHIHAASVVRGVEAAEAVHGDEDTELRGTGGEVNNELRSRRREEPLSYGPKLK
jgi:hypothetical protein